jgi:hypothetical protein
LFTHGAILERMLGRIAVADALGTRPLRSWGTRAPDDPGIALLSAQAGAMHVLAWNLHRLYADSTLPASEDLDALVAMTRLLGHKPRPAISATTVLSFALEEFDGSPTSATIPRGTKVSTIAAPDEAAQVFETDAEIEARREWNRMKPLRGPEPQQVTVDTDHLLVEGVDLPIRAGDHLLAWSGESAGEVTWIFARVADLMLDAQVEADVEGESGPPHTVIHLAGQRSVTAALQVTDPTAEGSVILLADRAQSFGATAPDITFLPDAVRKARGEPTGDDSLPTEWNDFNLVAGTNGVRSVYLDAVHPAAAPGRVVLFEADMGAPAPAIARIRSAVETARSDFGLSARSTLLGIEGSVPDSFDSLVRQTSILLETGRVKLVVPFADPVMPILGPDAPPQHPEFPAESSSDRLYLEGDLPLPPGRQLVFSGDSAEDGSQLIEASRVASTTRVEGPGTSYVATLVVLDDALAGRWRASGLVVYGNSVEASQGETPSFGAETIGSGDASMALPRYALAQRPLAHVPRLGVRGYGPAIEVRVDQRSYELADTLFGESSDSKRFRVLPRWDGRSEVQFGGRLPSGIGNVVALYRTGGGAAGNVAAGRVVQPLTPVLGVRSISNLLRAEGGSDPETIDEVRATAPKAIRTFERAVSLADFEAFAEGYRGVGRASAVDVRLDGVRTVCVTISTTTYDAPEPGSALFTDLHDALVAAAPPGSRVRVSGFVDIPMDLEFALASDQALRRLDVEAAVRAALVGRFGPAARRFGEAVHRSQLLATVQEVPGVAAVRLITFEAESVDEDPEGRLPCPGPRVTTAGFEPAGRLSVLAEAISFQEFPA